MPYTFLNALKMAFNYNMASHTNPYEEVKGYEGPVLLIRADDGKIADEASFLAYAQCYKNPEIVTTETGGHNFTSIPVRKALTEACASFIVKHS